MLERVIENWLTSVNERAFELPFCQLLAGKGHTILHLSRHGPLEQGKDVITLDSNGTPCAIQIKCPGPKLALAQWASIVDQVNRLVEVPISHPAIDATLPRRAILAVNGDLDEEVRQEIVDRNRDWVARGHPSLEVMVRGEILQGLKELQTDFWPITLEFERDLLDLFLQDGASNLDKLKFSQFLGLLLPIAEPIESPLKLTRRATSAAVFTSYALSPFERRSNHVATFEGWIMFLASLIAAASKSGLGNKAWSEPFNLGLQAALSSLRELLDELKERRYFVEGNALMDSPFYAARLTWLSSLMSAYALHCVSVDPDWPELQWVERFVLANLKHLHFWGEAATTQFLSVFWLLTLTRPPKESIALLFTLLKAICARNTVDALQDLPDPYHEFSEIVEYDLGLKRFEEREHFRGRSFSIDTLTQLIASRGWRQTLNSLWPKISRVACASFRPEEPSHYCLWRTDHGNLSVSYPQTPRSWSSLLAQSRSHDCSFVPPQLLSRPQFLMFFLLVFPHRLNSDVAKYLDGYFGDLVAATKAHTGDAA